ncbi:MAG: type II secretion system F family protein [Planctomycetaceae bacterium]
MIDLNREIAALVRAGVPLEAGLSAISADEGSPASELAGRLSDRLQAGMSLADALRAEQPGFSPEYIAILESGLRSGRLPEALESLCGLVELEQESLQRTQVAFVYPLLVSILAWSGVCLFLPGFTATLRETYGVMNVPAGMFIGWLSSISDFVGGWGWPLLLAVVVGMCVWSLWVAILRPGGPGLSGSLLSSLPPLPAARRHYEVAHACQLLAALIEQQVPLADGVRLTAGTLKSRGLRLGLHKYADSLTAGIAPAEAATPLQAGVPLLGWLLSTPASPVFGPAAFRQAAKSYEQRGRQQFEWFRLLFPVGVVVLIGGGAVTLYALTVFLPLSEMLERMMWEPAG